MDRKLFFLRLCYWLGILADGYAAIRLLIIRLSVDGPPELVRAAGIGAALMVGWTVLLIWANRKPLERIDVLKITMFPVLILLLINYLLNLFANGAILQAEIHNVVIISVLILHFSLAIWINTRKPQVLTG